MAGAPRQVTSVPVRAAAHEERPLADVRISDIKSLVEAKDYSSAIRELQWAIRLPQEPVHLRRFAALMKRIPNDAVAWPQTSRIAILSSTTLADRADLLRLYLASDLIGAEIYQGPFGFIDEEILDPTSGYNRFRPDFTILSPTSHATAYFEEAGPNLDLARWRSLWDAIRKRHQGRIVHHALEVPRHPVAGNLDLTLSEGVGRRIRYFNLELSATLPTGVSILDVESLSASVGKDSWSDPRFWFLAKESTSDRGRVLLAHAEAALIRGFLGLSKKVLALDLDDTLWGGVIGEEGLSGIRLAGDAVGEAFVAFQRYLKALRARGVLLVLISKNNEADVREVFESHPEMVLSWGDFASVRINWRPKSENLREIATELSLNLDAFVFVDDDPKERAEIRVELPEVTVLTMPADPCNFIATVADGRWFDVPVLSGEDYDRAEDYRVARASRRLLETAETVDSLESFLESLELEAEIAAFDELNLPRILQLIQKTNQYNLTTRRYTEAMVERLMATPGVHTRFLRLRDRFADRGIVSVVIARELDDAIDVDTWLTSCRVLGRTVEHALLGHLIELAILRDKAWILGKYVPTAKNSLAEDHYARLGFDCVGEDPAGHARWKRAAAADAPRSFVRIADSMPSMANRTRGVTA